MLLVAWWNMRRLPGSGENFAQGTLMDVPSIACGRRLVRLMEHGDGADGIAQRLESLFQVFPPDEKTMRRISLYHQMCERTGGEDEFCMAMLHVVATACIQMGYTRPPPVSTKWSPGDLMKTCVSHGSSTHTGRRGILSSRSSLDVASRRSAIGTSAS